MPRYLLLCLLHGKLQHGLPVNILGGRVIYVRLFYSLHVTAAVRQRRGVITPALIVPLWIGSS